MSESDHKKRLSYEEAVRVLGYEPGDVVEPNLPVFRSVEENLETMIETSADDEVKTRLRGELGRLHEALGALDAEVTHENVAPRAGARVWVWVSVMLIGCLVGLAWIGNSWVTERRDAAQSERIVALLAEGDAAVEKRRWPEAKEIYDQILAERPGFGGALEGLRRIEDGKAEERRQQVGFLVGTTQAAIEGRRWDEAESASRELRAVDPGNEKLASIVDEIAAGRVADRIVTLVDDAEEAIREEDWDKVSIRTRQLGGMAPDHPELPRLRTLAADGMELLKERRARARELYTEALAMDTGTFSPEALEVLREAMRLADRPEYHGLYDKISGYARTLEVPGEFQTVADALAAARPRDKVRVAAGTYKETLTIPSAIELEGAGPGKTIFECRSADASVVSVPHDSKGARLAGVTLQQSGIELTDERFPVVAIDGGEITIDNCRIENGSGHGVAVVNGGGVRLRDVRVEKCGWDGLSVYGEGSRGEAESCRFSGNLHHGIDAWNGGAVTISKCRSSGNGLAGIVIMSPAVLSKVTETTCDGNRELGVLVADGAAAELTGNQMTSNLLGGVLVRDAGTTVTIVGNRILKNGRAGLVVGKRAKLVTYEGNEISQNTGQQVDLKAVLEDSATPKEEPPVETPKVVPPPEVPDELAEPDTEEAPESPGD